MPFALPLLLTLWLPAPASGPGVGPASASVGVDSGRSGGVRVGLAPRVAAWTYDRDDASEGFEGEIEPTGHGAAGAPGPRAPGPASSAFSGLVATPANGPPYLPLLRLASRLNC